jgi:hypothetical protein
METQPGRIAGPPRRLEAILERLMPSRFAHVIGDLDERYVSPRQYLREAAGVVPRVVAWQISRVFDPVRTATDACVIALSFAGAPVGLPLMLVLGAALPALALRDAYGHSSRAVRDSLGDAVLAVAFVLVSQALVAAAAPGLALETGLLVRGSSIGLVAVAAHRCVRRGELRGIPRPSRRRYRWGRAASVLWMTAGAGLMLSGVEAMPRSVPARDFLLGAVLVLAFTVAYRPQLAPALRAREFGPFFSSVPGPPIAAFRGRSDGPGGRQPAMFPRDFPNRAGRWLVFAVLAFPLGAAIWNGVAGHGEDIDGFRLGAHLGLLSVLTVVWPPLRRRTRAPARAGDL